MSATSRLKRLARLVVRPASAHCDTADGPVVTAGRRALATGQVEHALPWVHEDAEDEVRSAFDAVRAADATLDAETRFLETLVRLHRAGEGADFDGIKPAGTPQPAIVTAADRALAQGSLAVVEPWVDGASRAGVADRFATALARRDFDPRDVPAGRAFVEAYVDYVHHAAHSAAHSPAHSAAHSPARSAAHHAATRR
jgi:hypothetical protein